MGYWIEEFGLTLAKVTAILILILFLYVNAFEDGEESLLEEMNKYGNVRIDGKVYIIEEVISGDK